MATIKLPVLVQTLKNLGDFVIKVVITEHAKHFFKDEDIPQDVEIVTDDVEWKSWKNRGDPVVHIELSKWADLLLIAPLDANSLAKISNVSCIKYLKSSFFFKISFSIFYCRDYVITY